MIVTALTQHFTLLICFPSKFDNAQKPVISFRTQTTIVLPFYSVNIPNKKYSISVSLGRSRQAKNWFSKTTPSRGFAWTAIFMSRNYQMPSDSQYASNIPKGILEICWLCERRGCLQRRVSSRKLFKEGF